MSKLSDYEYSILDEIRRDEINQALRLKDLVERKIIELDNKGNELFNQGTQDYETDILHSLLHSLLDDSTKNEETVR